MEQNPAALLSTRELGLREAAGPGCLGAPGEVNSAGEWISLFILYPQVKLEVQSPGSKYGRGAGVTGPV